MSNSDINRIEPIVPYSEYSPSSTTSGIASRIWNGGPPQERKKYKGLIEEKLKEMDEKENVERIQKNKEQEALFKEKLKKNYGNELFAREINEVGELKTNELSLGECKKKLKMCGICGGHLDPSNFGNENSVVMVGDGRHTYPELEYLKNQEDLGRFIEQQGVGPRTKKLGITFGQLYNEYTEKCNTDKFELGCLSTITTNKYLEEMSKRFSYTDIVCGHKFHKECIWGEIKKQEGRLHEHGTVTGGVNCPTCDKQIRKLYYFLPTYCDKIDENGQFIVRKKQPSATAIPIATAIHTDIPTAIPTTAIPMATAIHTDIPPAIPTAIPKVIPTMKPPTPPLRSAMKNAKLGHTKQNKTKKKFKFADKNELRILKNETTEYNDYFGGRGKRKRVCKTRRKNRKHKKTRKYKKN